MKYKILIRSKKIKGFKKEVGKTYRKIIENSKKVEKEKLLFRIEK